MINDDIKKSNYILLFRELHNNQVEKDVQLKLLAGKTIKLTNIETGKSWTQKISSDGKTTFKLKEPGSYLFIQYMVIG